jgi:FtsH-binding integral membrane protein
MVYWLTVSIAYGVKGANTSEFLPDSVPEGLGRRIAGFLVVLHITVSYVIVCQPLHSWFHLKLFPRTYQKESKLGTVHWFLITVGYLIFGFVVGNLIPFFADVQAFIGSLFGAPTIFGWPPAFYIYLHRQQTNSWNEAAIQMGYGNAAVCVIFLFVCTPLFCVLGTSGAIQSIFEDSKDSVNKPFQCY